MGTPTVGLTILQLHAPSPCLLSLNIAKHLSAKPSESQGINNALGPLESGLWEMCEFFKVWSRYSNLWRSSAQQWRPLSTALLPFLMGLT